MSQGYDADHGAQDQRSIAMSTTSAPHLVSTQVQTPLQSATATSAQLNARSTSPAAQLDVRGIANGSSGGVTEAPDPSHIPADASREGNHCNQVAPPISIVPSGPHDLNLPQTSPPTQLTATIIEGDVQPSTQSQGRPTSAHNLLPELHDNLDGPAQVRETAHEGNMIFGYYSAAQAAQRRRNYAMTNALTDYEADMTSKDRAKQKEAVKRYLTERVKQDWTWEWPRPEPSSPSAITEASGDTLPAADRVYTGEEEWKERDEWLSNASEDEDHVGMPTSVSSPDTPSTRHSPYRFESPDGVGDTVKRTQWERKQRRKKRLAEEMAWNGGLQCFVARRDAWTGARKVSRAPFGLAPVKTVQKSSVSSEDGGSSTAMEKEEDVEWEDDVEIPIAPPILPPENQMRASILPGAYNTIYDKVVVQSLQPSCPMNLKDVTRSCVQGWKRDGEWPTKSSVPEPKKKGRKMSVASLFGLDKPQKEEPQKVPENKEKETHEKKPSAGSGIRRSIQKILSLGHNKDAAHNGNGKLAKGGAGPPPAAA